MWKREYDNAQTGSALKPMCMCSSGAFKRWEEVRCVVEQEEGWVVTRESLRGTRSKDRGGSDCIIAILERDANLPHPYPLGDDTNIQECGLILMMRVAVLGTGIKDRNTYVPASVRSHKRLLKHRQETQNQVELYKREYALSLAESRQNLTCQHTVRKGAEHIEAVREQWRLNVMKTLISIEYSVEPEANPPRHQHRCHPSRKIIRSKYPGFLLSDGTPIDWEDVPKPTPNPGEVCCLCYNYFSPEHYQSDCPSIHVDKWIPMNKRSPPHGIPLRQLTPVDWDDEKDVATAPYRDSQGELWRPRGSL